MEFNILEVRKYFNKENINSQIIKDFMEYERTHWHDSLAELYNNEDERCLDHCKNIINGIIKEIIFNKYVAKDANFIYRGKLGYVYDRDFLEIGKTDYYLQDGCKYLDIEFKAYDNYMSNDEIIKELTDKNLYTFKYHECDMLMVWFPLMGIVKSYTKENDKWIVLKWNLGETLEKMSDEYFQLKVEKIVC